MRRGRWWHRFVGPDRHGPYREGPGSVALGAGTVLAHGPVRSHLSVADGATLTIGAQVFVGFGASISCQGGVTIGERTRIGNYALIMDSDFHVPGANRERPPPSPISIGRRVLIGDHVTILSGATIGDHVTVEPGSVVWGTIQAGTTVAGRPRR